MTRAIPVARPAVELLVTLLMESEQPYDNLLALRPALTGSAWDETCIAMEVCEVHLCDERICADDQRPCPAGRSTR